MLVSQNILNYNSFNQMKSRTQFRSSNSIPAASYTENQNISFGSWPFSKEDSKHYDAKAYRHATDSNPPVVAHKDEADSSRKIKQYEHHSAKYYIKEFYDIDTFFSGSENRKHINELVKNLEHEPPYIQKKVILNGDSLFDGGLLKHLWCINYYGNEGNYETILNIIEKSNDEEFIYQALVKNCALNIFLRDKNKYCARRFFDIIKKSEKAQKEFFSFWEKALDLGKGNPDSFTKALYKPEFSDVLSKYSAAKEEYLKKHSL